MVSVLREEECIATLDVGNPRSLLVCLIVLVNVCNPQIIVPLSRLQEGGA